MSNKPEKKQTGKVNYIWVLAGGYLVYLAVQLIFGAFRGDTDKPAVGIIGGIVFLLVGGGVLLREWKAYKYGVEHIDDPSTWSNEDEELEAELAEIKTAALEAAEEDETPAAEEDEEDEA